jgi:DNA polymerase-3 subunit gamma/tau
LVGRLKEWTGERWLIVAQGGGGAESLWEKQKRAERETRAEIEQDPFVVSVLEAFPGAEIIGVRNLAQPDAATTPASDDDSANDED